MFPISNLSSLLSNGLLQTIENKTELITYYPIEVEWKLYSYDKKSLELFEEEKEEDEV